MTDIEENMQELALNFAQFLNNDKIKNAWVYEQDLAIYVRRSLRWIEGDILPCFDIASVEVAEHVRGRGVFKAFLYKFEEAARKKKRHIFVESILTPRFRNFFLKRGYKIHPHANELCPCLYKVLS